jgi:hypothetical protein
VEGGVVVRVGDLVVVDGRGPRDGGGDGRRADLLKAHGWGLGLLLLRRRRRGGGPRGELLDYVAELVLADVVDLRLRLRRA